MKGVIVFSVVLLTLGTAATTMAISNNFTGAFRRDMVTGDSCGKSITLRRLRHNQFRIDWELSNGEHFVVELEGKPLNGVLDFRKGQYGYTYRLSEHGTILTIDLKTPTEARVCTFFRDHVPRR